MTNPVSAVLRNERSLSVLVPFTACHTPHDLLTKPGALVRTFAIKGLPFETSAQADIDGDVAALHSFVKSFADERVAIHQHTIQRKCKVPDLMPSFNNDFARQLCTEYQNGLESSYLLVADLYLTVVYLCEESNDRGFLSTFGNSLKKVTSSLEELKHIRKKGLEAISKISREIETGLAAYGPRLLGEYTDEYGSTISEPLTFQNYLISGFHETIQKPSGIPLWDYLGSGSYFAGLDLIELRRGNERCWAQMLMVKGYGEGSYAGLLDDLYTLDVEFISCVTYCGLQRHTASNKLRDQATYQNSVGNTDVAEQINEVRAGLDAGSYGVGEFTVTLRVMGDTPEGVLEDTAKVMGAMKHRSMNPQTCGLGTDAGYFSQVPGCEDLRLRVPMYTTENFCDAAPMHNDHEGKKTGNPWGNALMTLTTKNNRIAYLNLHHVESHKDLKGSKPPGSTVIVGQTGAGKSTLLNLMNLFMMQFDNADAPLLSITLDFKQGCRKTIEAMGGVYSQLKNEQSTGYNPFKMEPTPNNIIFLVQQVIFLCSQGTDTVTTTDRADINRAVRTVMRQPKADRGFTLLLQSIPFKPTEDSLHLRLAPWASSDSSGRVGEHAWALDNQDDCLDFTVNSVFGIDGTDLLTNDTVRTPVLMYLIYRIQQVLGTRRVGFFVDELWKWLGNEDITHWIVESLSTIRSRDGVVVMATQMPESILASLAGDAVIQQAATILFLKNPRAKLDVYRKLGMTPREFRALMELKPYHFLFKQDGTSVTATAGIGSLSQLNRSIITGDSQ